MHHSGSSGGLPFDLTPLLPLPSTPLALAQKVGVQQRRVLQPTTSGLATSAHAHAHHPGPDRFLPQRGGGTGLANPATRFSFGEAPEPLCSPFISPPLTVAEGVENVAPSPREQRDHRLSFSASQARLAESRTQEAAELAATIAREQVEAHQAMMRHFFLGFPTTPQSPAAASPRLITRSSLSPQPQQRSRTASNTPRTSLTPAPAPASASQATLVAPSPQRPIASLGLAVGLDMATPSHLRASSVGAWPSGTSPSLVLGLGGFSPRARSTTPHPMSPLTISSTPSSRRVSGAPGMGSASVIATADVDMASSTPRSNPSSSPVTPSPSAAVVVKKHRSSLGYPSTSTAAASSSVFVFSDSPRNARLSLTSQSHTASVAAAIATAAVPVAMTLVAPPTPASVASASASARKRRSDGALSASATPASSSARSASATPNISASAATPLRFGKHLSRSIKKAQATIARLAPTPSRVASLPSTSMLAALQSPAPSSSPTISLAAATALATPSSSSAAAVRVTSATPSAASALRLATVDESPAPAARSWRRLTFSAALAAPSTIPTPAAMDAAAALPEDQEDDQQ